MPTATRRLETGDDAARAAALLLAGFGTAGAWFWVLRWADPPEWSWLAGAVALAVAVASFPPARKRVRRGMRAWSRLDRRRPAWATAAVTLLCGLAAGTFLLYPNPDWPGRLPAPVIHDEFVYQLQARTLVETGRIWMPAHPLGDFFETFHIVRKPVYAGMFPPGVALVLAPLIATGLPAWLGPLAATAAAGGLTYRLGQRLAGPAAGMAAAALLVGSGPVRAWAAFTVGQPFAMLWAVVVLRLLFAWWRKPTASRALLAGLAFGMLAITRPFDAVLLGLPVAPIVLWRLPNLGVRRAAATLAAASLGVGLFAAGQAHVNLRTTGDPLTTLHQLNYAQEYPELRLGFGDEPADLSVGSQLPRKRRYREEFVTFNVVGRTPGFVVEDWFTLSWYPRARRVAEYVLAAPALIALLPAGLLAWRDPRAVAATAAVVTFAVGYSLYPIGLPAYFLPAAPAACLLAVLGGRRLAGAFGAGRWWPGVWAALMLLGVAAAARPVWIAGGEARPEWARVRGAVATVEAEGRPAVILFHQPDSDWFVEPVYNLEAAWPDDQLVVRANDLGDGNGALFRYYARRQPGRVAWRYDVDRDVLVRLGVVSELVR